MGVRIAMPIAQAGELAGGLAGGRPAGDGSASAPPAPTFQPRIEKHDPWIDRESLGQIATLFQDNLCPLVAIDPLDDHPWAGHPLHQPDSLLCDISGVAHLFAGEVGLLRAAQASLAAIGLVGQLAIANSVGAVWALAHHAETLASKNPTSKNSASKPLDSSTPTSSTPTPSTPGECSQPGDQIVTAWAAPIGAAIQQIGRQQFGRLPIESLRIAPATSVTLRRLGIESVDPLLRLPKSALATRLGKVLVRRIGQLTGEIDEPLSIHRRSLEHSHALDLDYPTSDQAILRNRIEQLIEQACLGLATNRLGALQLTCRLDLASGPPRTLEIGLFAPTLDVDHLAGLMTNQLENKRLSSHVVRLTISVTHAGPLRSLQTPLFQDEHDGAPDTRITPAGTMRGAAVCRLVDSLSGRLGRDAVLGVSLSDDPLPENAFHVFPLTGNKTKTRKGGRPGNPKSANQSKAGSRQSGQPGNAPSNAPSNIPSNALSNTPSPQDAMRRPLSLLPRPIPLAVAQGSSCSPDGRLPDHFRLDGVTYQIVRHWGPERIETGWWKGPTVRRDYYRIETDRATWWWIFRDFASPTPGSPTHTTDPEHRCRWMLHGRFA